MITDPILVQLHKRLQFWENELEIERSAHPEPAARLDAMVEEFIDESATLMSRLADQKERNKELQAMVTTLETICKSQDQILTTKEARVKVLEARLAMIRKGLGIENQGEDSWI